MNTSLSRHRLPVLARRLPAVAAALGAALLAFAVFTSTAAPSAIWSPRLVDHPGYSPADPPVVQEAWPQFGTAAGLGGRLNAWSRTALDAAGVGGRADLSGPAPIAGAAAVLLVFVTVRQLGGGLLAAFASALGLAFGGLFWSRTTGGQPATYAAFFALGTLSALLWWRSSRRWSAGLVAATSMGLAVAAQPITFAGLPVALFFVSRERNQAARERLAIGLTFVVATALGVASVWRAFGSELSLSAWLLPHGVSGFVERLSAAGEVAVSDFGVLGLAFLAAGVVALALERPRSALLLFGGWSAAVVCGGMIWAAPDWRTSVLPALSPAWVVVGLGMNWMLAPVGGRGPSRVAAALAVLLPVMSFAGHHWVGARAASARQFVVASLDHLDGTLPARPVVIAEGGAVDRAVSSRSRDGEDSAWGRVAQDPERVQRLVDRGVPVVGFTSARRNLEELGFRFVPVDGTGMPMTLDQVIETVPPGWIVAIAGGSGFVQALPPHSGATFAAIGGTETLFGVRSVRYAIIGIKGRAGVALEEVDPASAELAVRTGEPLGPTFRAPAAIRVSSSERGGIVEYGGRRVAATNTGVAVAIVSAAGDLAGAYGVEYEDGMRIPITPGTLRPARVVGREPCVSVGPTEWTDLSELGRYGSIGALLRRGQQMELYVGAAHPLNVRQAALRHQRVPEVRITPIEGPLEAGLAAALGELPFVYHVRVVPAGARRSQLALRLGGFADVTMARVSAGGGQTVVACSAMRGGPALFARSGRPAQGEELDLENAGLFPYGWSRFEGTGRRGVRWTRVHDAEMLVPLSERGGFVLEIEAQPVGTLDTTLTVEINDFTLEEVAVLPGPGVYRWEVPEDVWRAGMNRVRVSTPTLSRPSEVIGNHDDRLLGLGVSRVRLTPVETAAVADAGR